jgi:hypothetical protein
MFMVSGEPAAGSDRKEAAAHFDAKQLFGGVAGVGSLPDRPVVDEHRARSVRLDLEEILQRRDRDAIERGGVDAGHGLGHLSELRVRARVCALPECRIVRRQPQAGVGEFHV